MKIFEIRKINENYWEFKIHDNNISFTEETAKSKDEILAKTTPYIVESVLKSVDFKFITT